MTWTVVSSLMRWPAGTVLTDADIDAAGLDAAALIEAGHLAGPAPDAPAPTAVAAPDLRLLTGAAARAVAGDDWDEP